jgi:hypothetical protein
MKIINFKYIVCLLSLALVFSCEDDDPISAGNADPLNKIIVDVPVTVSSPDVGIGEGNLAKFDVTLGQSFASDATITVRIDMDNGRFTTGTTEVPAGSTSASGTILVPADDSLMPATIISPNSATIQAIGILLDEPVADTVFAADSNVFDLNVWSQSQEIDAGLVVQMDWNGAPAVDVDMYIIDAGFTAIFEQAESGDRFEVDLFGNAEHADGDYVVYTRVFAPDPLTDDTPLSVLLVKPDNVLESFSFTVPAGTAAADGFIPLVQFTKNTNAETGVTSYTAFSDVSTF